MSSCCCLIPNSALIDRGSLHCTRTNTLTRTGCCHGCLIHYHRQGKRSESIDLSGHCVSMVGATKRTVCCGLALLSSRTRQWPARRAHIAAHNRFIIVPSLLIWLPVMASIQMSVQVCRVDCAVSAICAYFDSLLNERMTAYIEWPAIREETNWAVHLGSFTCRCP